MPSADSIPLEEAAQELDAKAAEMLGAIEQFGGAATTSEIRSETNHTNSEVRHRRRKLADLGLVEVGTRATANERINPKEHLLTDHAEALLDAGLVEAVGGPDPGDFEELASLVQELQASVAEQSRTIDQLESNQRRLFKWFGSDFKFRGTDPLDQQLEEIRDTLSDLDERLEGKRDKGFL